MFTEDAYQNAYGVYRITTAYLWSQGILQIPVASSTLSVSQMAQVSQPMGSKIVFWLATQTGSYPTCPSTAGKSGEVLNFSQVIPHAPKITPDGDDYVYGISGMYAFHLSTPVPYDQGTIIQPQEPLDTGSPQPISPGDFINPAASGTSLFSGDHLKFSYTEYETATEYVWINGTVQQPTTTVGASCEIIQSCSPYGWRKVTWSAEREGAPPVLPSPVPLEGEFLNYWMITPASPKLMSDGQTYIFRVEGEYWFHCDTPYDVESDMPGIGVLGYDGGAEQALSSSDFDDNLIRIS